jgi:hypothetical protein
VTEGPWVQKWKQEREAENAAGLAELMRHPECRAWLQNLIEYLADASTFNSEPLTQAFLQGRRSVGMDLRASAQTTNFDLYYRMIGERQHSARSYLAAKKNDADKIPVPKEK